MLASLFTHLLWWHWLVLALLLLLAELAAPAFYVLWIAVAALLTSLIMLLLQTLDAGSLAWQWQWLLFGLLSIACLFAGRSWVAHRPIATDRPQLNRRGEQYVGRQFTLSEPIVNGRGVVQVDDTRWRVSGDDLPAGATVTVTGIDGTTMVVTAAH